MPSLDPLSKISSSKLFFCLLNDRSLGNFLDLLFGLVLVSQSFLMLLLLVFSLGCILQTVSIAFETTLVHNTV